MIGALETGVAFRRQGDFFPGAVGLLTAEHAGGGEGLVAIAITKDFGERREAGGGPEALEGTVIHEISSHAGEPQQQDAEGEAVRPRMGLVHGER